MSFIRNRAGSTGQTSKASCHQVDEPLSIGDMLSFIELERARADRNSHEFSIVAFPLHGKRWQPTLVRQLLEILLERVRVVDQVGWLPKQQIGIVLPHTGARAARQLVSDLAKSTSGFPVPDCNIFTYPVQELEGSNGTDPGNGHSLQSVQSPEIFLRTSQPLRDHHAAFKTFNMSEMHGGVQTPLWKRSLDLLGSVTGLVFFAPLLLLISILIKLSSSGPVLFQQQRLGRHGRPFTFWKFRTMKLDADETPHRKHLEQLINSDQPMVKLDALMDSRTFPLGRFLRRTCLDELPQFFNVLKGEMSLVGPRPCLPYEAEHYKLWQTRRFDILPGMTGLWQISGKNATTFKDMIRFDIKYAREYSLQLDVKIILKTIPLMFNQIRIGLGNFG